MALRDCNSQDLQHSLTTWGIQDENQCRKESNNGSKGENSQERFSLLFIFRKLQENLDSADFVWAKLQGQTWGAEAFFELLFGWL